MSCSLPQLQVESRQYPVTIHFNRRTPDDYVEEALRKVCKIHTTLQPGNILVFVTGQQEVHSLCRALRGRFGCCQREGGYDSDVPESEVIGEEGEGEAYGWDEGEEEEEERREAGASVDFYMSLKVLPLYSLLSSAQQAKVSVTRCQLVEGESQEMSLVTCSATDDLRPMEVGSCDLDSCSASYLAKDGTVFSMQHVQKQAASSSRQHKFTSLHSLPYSCPAPLRSPLGLLVSPSSLPQVLCVPPPPPLRFCVPLFTPIRFVPPQVLCPPPLPPQVLCPLCPLSLLPQVFVPPPEGMRLCVVATNVAETSLTIPNIKYVVDTGKVKRRYYDKVTGISTFR